MISYCTNTANSNHPDYAEQEYATILSRFILMDYSTVPDTQRPQFTPTTVTI